MTSQTAGLHPTMTLAAHRNRIFYLVWGLCLVSFLPATVTKYHDLVPAGSNPQDLMTTLGHNPPMRAMLGVPFDLMQPGGFAMWRVGTFTAAATAMMAALGVVRVTRDEEEAGRTELLRSTAVGPAVPLIVGAGTGMVASLIVGLLIVAAMIAAGTPVAGSIACGLGIGLTGAMWAALAAVAAQVFSTGRAARSWTLGAGLGGLYVVRGVLDAAPEGWWTALRWAIPLEWAQLVRPFAHERWWVLLLPVAFTAALSVLALRLQRRRDEGAGLVGAGTGPARGPDGLDSAHGLVWRLERTSVWSWVFGIIVSAVGMGSLSSTMDSLTKGNTAVAEMMRRMGGSQVLVVAFYQAMLMILTTILAIAAIQLLTRARSEETAGRAEIMLATPTRRTAYLAAHVSWALAMPIVLVLCVGALLPLVEVLVHHNPQRIGDLVGAAATLTPGLALVVGLAVAVLGWAPRLLPAVWAVGGWAVFCIWLAPVLDLPGWLTRLQPWGPLPKLPTDQLAWSPVIAESLVVVLLIVAGFVGYRRRDIGG